MATMGELASIGDYRLYNDGCWTVPYLITIEKRKMYGDCVVWVKVNDKIFTDYNEAVSVMMDMYNQEAQEE